MDLNKKNILYISMTGMTEPLGRSQVLEYLIDLSKENKIYLISFEREHDLDSVDEIKDLIEEHNIECIASLERFMRCGIGICGSCVIDKYVVCKDGPVFNSEQLRQLKELGKFAKDPSGTKVNLDTYYNKGSC